MGGHITDAVWRNFRSLPVTRCVCRANFGLPLMDTDVHTLCAVYMLKVKMCAAPGPTTSYRVVKLNLSQIYNGHRQARCARVWSNSRLPPRHFVKSFSAREDQTKKKRTEKW